MVIFAHILAITGGCLLFHSALVIFGHQFSSLLLTIHFNNLKNFVGLGVRVIPDSVQVLHLTLCSGVTPSDVLGTICGARDGCRIDFVQGKHPNVCIISLFSMSMFMVLFLFSCCCCSYF